MSARGRRPVAAGAARMRVAAAAVLVPAVVGLTLVTPRAPRARAGSASPPNVVIFMTDDQRADTMGMMPETRRWFGARGVSFPNGFGTTPLCCPARASLFTGQYVHNHGVRSNADAGRLDQSHTLQRYLQDAGYFTALSGKFLNKWDIATAPPHFDRYAMLRQGGDGYYGSTFNVDGTVRIVSSYSTHFIRRKALEYLEWFDQQDAAAPWLLYVKPFAPHNPALPSRRYEDAPIPRWRLTPADLEEDRTDKPPIVQEADRRISRAEAIRGRQLRSLMSVDDLVDSVMRKVRELGEATQTLAFFLSDNGFMWADHGWDQGKRAPYVPGIELPFFARWPGRLQPGTIDLRLVTNLDIAPTVLDAAGVSPDHVVDGRSLLDSWQRGRLLIEHFRDARVQPWASTWTPGMQYTEWYADDEETVVFREYYDLINDPWQLTNLLGDQSTTNDPPPDEVARLAVQLDRDRRCAGTTGPSACP